MNSFDTTSTRLHHFDRTHTTSETKGGLTSTAKVMSTAARQRNRAPQTLSSKKLSWLLRHGAQKAGLSIRSDGYVPLDEICRHCQCGPNAVHQIVKNCLKQRFGTATIDGVAYVRANQGHTIKAVKSKDLLTLVTDPKELGLVVHGTNPRAWKLIQQSGGLNRMKRNHIHMAIGLPGDKGVISGMRNSASVHIYLDGVSMLRDGIELYRSANDVILCEGDKNGMVPMKYFKTVQNSSRKVIWSPKLSSAMPSTAQSSPACVAAAAKGTTDTATKAETKAVDSPPQRKTEKTPPPGSE